MLPGVLSNRGEIPSLKVRTVETSHGSNHNTPWSDFFLSFASLVEKN